MAWRKFEIFCNTAKMFNLVLQTSKHLSISITYPSSIETIENICKSHSRGPFKFDTARLAVLTLPIGGRGNISHTSLPHGQLLCTVVTNGS